MKRIFAAVRIEPQQAIHNLMQQMKHQLAADRIKWVEEENMHITLKFFGETPDDKVIEIAEALKEIAPTPSFSIEFTHLGIFGSSYKPRVIWLGTDDGGNLANLSEAVRKTILPLGFEDDRQNFVPHLTLGRINFINDKSYFQKTIDSFSTVKFSNQPINGFYLYESILSPAGPKYSVIESYKL